jgi:hypothetical protein
MKDNKFWKDYGWIIRGSQRSKVIKMFPDKPITAETLRKEINSKTDLKLSLREISRHLTSFTKQGLLKCLTPDAPYGRLYILTEKGKMMKLEVKENKL